MKCEFSLAHYKECIELARDEGYKIKSVRDHYFDSLNGKKVILLRHDVDFSLEYAYELANIEYDMGVFSSYYIYLHSELYNPLSPKSLGMIRAMSKMGHEIGLHYDSRYDVGQEDILMSRISESATESVGHHWPASNEFINYSNLLNPNKLEYKYISDSGRNWRNGCLCQNIGKYGKLHVSMHPEWWIGGGVDRWNALGNMFVNYQATLARNITDVKNMIADYEREVINKI